MVRVAPADRESLQVAVALEVAPRHLLLLAACNTGEDDIDETEGDLDAVCHLDACIRVPRLDLERGDSRLMPVVVLRMEEGGAGRVGEDNVAVLVQDLLSRDCALLVVDPVDRARRDLAATSDLQVPRPQVDVRRREAKPLSLMV